MSFRASALFLVVLLSVPAIAQVPGAGKGPALRIEWEEFKKLYDAKQIEVVDVRDAASFEAGHIPGARSIPLERVEREADQQAASLRRLKKPIVLYCA